MEPKSIQWCFDTGRYSEVLAWPAPSAPSDPGFSERHEYITRALIEQGRFDEAVGHAEQAVSQMPEDSGGRCCILLIATFVQISRAPQAGVSERFNRLIATLAGLGDPRWEAHSLRWAGRRILWEVSFQQRSLRDIAPAYQLCTRAVELLRAAGRPLEALAESSWLADRRFTMGRATPAESKAEWQAILGEATKLPWPPTIARCHLALADLALEDHLRSVSLVDEEFVLRCHDAAVCEYERASIVAPQATVLAKRGRILHRYGHIQAAADLRAAAEGHEAVGRFAQADVLWRELCSWHEHRGRLDEVQAIDERLERRNSQHDQISAGAAAVRAAHRAFTTGDLAKASEAAQSHAGSALTPGAMALLLQQQTQAALARNDRAAAAGFARHALELLRPMAPCTSLGETYAALAMTEHDPEVIRALVGQAAEADLESDQPIQAARRLNELAKWFGTLLLASFADDLYLEAQQSLDRATQILGDDPSTAATDIHVGILQTRAVLAQARGDLAGAQSWLLHATKLSLSCGGNVNAAFSYGYRGFVVLVCARANRKPGTFMEAACLMVSARDLFRKQGLLGEDFRVTRLAGSICREGGKRAGDDLRETMYVAAEQLLEEAAGLAQRLRLGRRDTDLLCRQQSQEDFSKTIQQFLQEGFLFAALVRENPVNAWTWLQRMKALGLLHRLADSSSNLPTPESVPPELQAEEQHLIRQRDQIPRNTPSSLLQWHKLSSQLEKTWEKISKVPGASVYAALRRGLPVSRTDWRTAIERQAGLALPDSRPLVAVHYYWPSNDPGDPIMLIERSDSPEIHIRHLPNLREPVESFLAMAFPPGQRSAVRKTSESYGGDQAWAEFFKGLIEPLGSLTRPDETLLLFPHGPLHAWPFHALWLDGMPLGERNPVCTAPNATIMMHGWERGLGESSIHTPPPSLILVPNYQGTGFVDLPHAATEAGHVGNLLGVKPSNGLELERGELMQIVSGAEYLHFVGHATEFPSGWDSGLELGAGVQLTALDLVRQSLQARLVTLSGCRTSRHRGSVGDELVGLVPSLLQAGASAVLASNWEVRDEPGTLFMRAFYTHLLGSPPGTLASAFQAAIRNVRQTFPSLADWAAFTLHGNWR